MKKNNGKTLCIIIYVLTVIVGGGGRLSSLSVCRVRCRKLQRNLKSLSRRRTRSCLWLSARYTSLPAEKSRRIKAAPTVKQTLVTK